MHKFSIWDVSSCPMQVVISTKRIVSMLPTPFTYFVAIGMQRLFSVGFFFEFQTLNSITVKVALFLALLTLPYVANKYFEMNCHQ